MEGVKTRISQKVEAVRAACSSREALIAAIETKESAQGKLQNRNPWTNEDLDISPKRDWTWGWWDYAAFWWSYGKPVLSLFSSKPRLTD